MSGISTTTVCNLNVASPSLASLLDTEKRLYESEFQLLVNQRIQTDMQERTNALLARKSERDRIVSQRKADRRNQEPL